MTATSLKTVSQTGLHVRYEKNGLILDALPIPFNADAVIIEANVRLPRKAQCEKRDFTLAWIPREERYLSELLIEGNATSPTRVLFRLRVPDESGNAIVRWRDHVLGEVEVPIVGMTTLLQGFALEMPSLHASFGEETAACRAVVSGQAKTIYASAIVRSPTVLAPASDWNLRVEGERENGIRVGTSRMTLTTEEMRQRQTLVTVQLPKLGRVGAYVVSWHLASRRLATQRLRVISKTSFLRSLRVSAARLLIERMDGSLDYVRALSTQDGRLSFDGINSVRPIFFVASNEAGVAGLASFTLRAQLDGVVTTLAQDQELLITEGLRAVALGSVSRNDLPRVKHFSLSCGKAILGNLPLTAAPSAQFNAEGGFAPLDDFLWSPAADEQLKDRLGKLLGDG